MSGIKFQTILIEASSAQGLQDALNNKLHELVDNPNVGVRDVKFSVGGVHPQRNGYVGMIVTQPS